MKSIYPALPVATTQPSTWPGPTGLASTHELGALPTASEAAVYQDLQGLLAQMPVTLYLLRGPAHVLDLVNLPAAASWGCSPDQVRGQPFFEALPHLRGQGYEAAYATVWQTQQVVAWREAPITGLRPPGGPVVLGYFDVTFQPFFEGQGCLTGILVTSHEVTEHVLARQRVHHATEELAATNAGLADYVMELTQAAHAAQVHAESQAAFLTQVLNQAPLAIGLFVGADYVVEVCNPGLLARWGRTLAQVLHQPLGKVLPNLQGQHLRELLDEVSRTGVPVVAPQPPEPGEPLAPVSFIYYPLRDAHGQTIAIAALAAATGESAWARP